MIIKKKLFIKTFYIFFLASIKFIYFDNQKVKIIVNIIKNIFSKHIYLKYFYIKIVLYIVHYISNIKFIIRASKQNNFL